MKNALILLSFFALVGCAPQILGQNDRSITIEFGGYPAAQAIADDYCKHHGNRIAVARSNPDGLAITFECVNK